MKYRQLLYISLWLSFSHSSSISQKPLKLRPKPNSNNSSPPPLSPHILTFFFFFFFFISSKSHFTVNATLGPKSNQTHTKQHVCANKQHDSNDAYLIYLCKLVSVAHSMTVILFQTDKSPSPLKQRDIICEQQQKRYQQTC